MTSVDSTTALERLRAGNRRFVAETQVDTGARRSHRSALVDGQSPFAILLSCSDSRVPAELVFDCGLGDLFVVRVAGNVVAPSLVGSIEFAAATFDTRLVVVMGHTRCGAVAATLASLAGTSSLPSENVRDIVDRISPAVVELTGHIHDKDELLRAAIRANVRASVGSLRHASRVLERRVADGRLEIVGAEYALETGEVRFL